VKKEEISEFCDFIDRYNSIGYGRAEVVETKMMIFVKLWNAGFSENEELEQDFIEKISRRYLMYNHHPIHIFSIYKILDEFENKELFKQFRKLDCYKKRKKFIYHISLE